VTNKFLRNLIYGVLPTRPHPSPLFSLSRLRDKEREFESEVKLWIMSNEFHKFPNKNGGNYENDKNFFTRAGYYSC
jgi:hypothetical protein